MRKISVTLGLILMMALNSTAQYFDKESNSKTKVGIRVGLGTSKLNGDVFENARLARAFTGGFYVRNKLSKHLNIQTEVLMSYRGSTFNHKDVADSFEVYDKILLLYADVPVFLMIDPKGDQKNNIMIGAQLSWLLRSSMFISQTKDGASKSVVPSYFNLPVKQYDLMACVGYLYSLENIGFMINFKYGLIDINSNFGKAEYSHIKPPFNGDGSIRSFVVDLSVSF